MSPFPRFWLITIILFGLAYEVCGEEISLQQRYDKIKAASVIYGTGGRTVLDTALAALKGRTTSQVSLEDLWSVALKEGKNLFNRSSLWSSTSAIETGDMLGQTTIGPWQITLKTARKYGVSHGVFAEWNDLRLIPFLERNPKIQAGIAADFLKDSYRQHGMRTPHALQNYFWLEGFLSGKIGQGKWFENVLARKPAGRRQTGFYAKQLLLGSRFNPQGLLYWLYVTGDHSAIRETLKAWKLAGYPILKSDLPHCGCDPKFQTFLKSRLD